jgi:hypothetical protein
MYKFTALLITVLLLGFNLTQAQLIPDRSPLVTGNETKEFSSNPIIKVYTSPTFGPVQTGSITFNVHNIDPTTFTGYDFQSNASTHQVWMDPNTPDILHAVFTNSQQTAAWNDRTCLYYGSTDGGDTWFLLGPVPINLGATNGRSGFPVISGTSDGFAVIMNHNNSNSTPSGNQTISKLYIDNDVLGYDFSEYDPLAVPGDNNEPIWPRMAVDSDDNVHFLSSQSVTSGTADSCYYNKFNSGSQTIAGWQVFDGDQGEGYSIAVSESGNKIGILYSGQNFGENNLHNWGSVFYRESTDGGSSWADPVTVFDAEVVYTDTPYYGNRSGIDLTYLGEEPCGVFERAWFTYSTEGQGGESYYPQLESDISFWSPSINGGQLVTIADSFNVPFYPNGFPPNFGNADGFNTISKPVIGRSANLGYLFAAFTATSGEYWPGTTNADSTAYMQGMFSYSSDGGATWSVPERFTPDDQAGQPRMDWRYVSIVPESPVSPVDDDIITIHMVMQGDTIPASVVNSDPPMPDAVSAQYYHFSGELLVVSNDDEIIANNFNLEQNYPNPFNPSTKINYTLAERSAVTLKVYDVLGNEVANLVNTTQEAGKYDVTFNASGLSSGLYIYTLNTGNFTSSKKMMLLK